MMKKHTVTPREAGEFLYQAMNIGEEMLECGGEVSRVEDSIRRICLAYGAARVDVFTITSSIVTTIYHPDFGAVTQTRRISALETNLHRLEALNQLSRQICQNTPELAVIKKRLEQINQEGRISFRRQCLVYMLVSASFSVFFGGSLLDAVSSALIGLLLRQIQTLFTRVRLNSFISMFLCALLGGFLARCAVLFGLGDSVDFISIGNIMLLIPGISLTNGIRDLFSGDTISGSLRFVDALVLSAIIAAGFALVSPQSAEAQTLQQLPWLFQLFTAFTGTLGFSLLFHVNEDKLMPACFGALLSWSIYLLLGRWITNDPARFLIASMALTLYAEIMARRKKAPTTIFLIPAAIPLFPGGSLYYTMQAAMENSWSLFFHRGLNTIMLAAAIAVGIVCMMSLFRTPEQLRQG